MFYREDDIFPASVDDAHQFFTNLDFPRFRLRLEATAMFDELDWHEYEGNSDEDEDDEEMESEAGWLERVVTVFTGMDDDEDYGAPKSTPTVRKFVEELLPHVDITQFLTKPIELVIHLTEYYPLHGLADTMQDLVTWTEENANRTAPPSLNAVLQGHLVFPQMRIKTLSFRNPEPFVSDRDVDELTEILDNCAVYIPHIDIAMGEYLDDDSCSSFMDTAVNLRGDANGRVGTLSLSFHSETPRHIETVMSALPKCAAGAVHTLRLRQYQGDEHTRGTMTRHGWLWLAYGLFHPDTYLSSWKNLILDEIDLSERNAAPLNNVQHAANAFYRHAYGSGTPPSVIGSVGSDFLRAGAPCYWDKSLTGDALCSWTGDGNVRLTAVIQAGVSSVAKLPQAVCVVVAGNSPGWVSKKDIVKVWEDGIESATLYGLRPSELRADSTLRISSFTSFGSWMTHLDLTTGMEQDYDANQLRDLCNAFEELRYLRVRHNGAFFHDWTDQKAQLDGTFGMELTTLELVVPPDEKLHAPSQDAWKSCLVRMTTLAIRTLGDETHRPIVKQFLHDGYPVERFVWSRCRVVDDCWVLFTKPKANDPEYTVGRQQSRRLLGLTRGGKFDMAQHAFSGEAKRAFRQVVRCKDLAGLL